MIDLSVCVLIENEEDLKKALQPRMTGGSTVPGNDFMVFPLLFNRKYDVDNRQVTSTQVLCIDSNMDITAMSTSNLFRSGRTSKTSPATVDCQTFDFGYGDWNAKVSVAQIIKDLAGKKITKAGKTLLYRPAFVNEKPVWEDAEQVEMQQYKAEEDKDLYTKAVEVFKKFVKDNGFENTVKLIDSEFAL